jgi:hypothetical protein
MHKLFLLSTEGAITNRRSTTLTKAIGIHPLGELPACIGADTIIGIDPALFIEFA